MAFQPLNTNGQKTMANSSPVVLASDQSAIPVTETVTDTAPATQNVTVIDSSSSSALGANGQTIVIGTPTAGSAASFALLGIETVRVEVTGIWTGTLTAEVSIDGGTTWTNQGLHQGAFTTASFTAGFIGGGNVAGSTNFRMRATATITGTAVVKVIESVNTQSVYIANAAPSGNYISLNNSSTATLTSGSVFTGIGEDVSNFSEMRITVFSDQASATNGLSIQQSSNNTNWDVTDTYTIAAASGTTFVVPRQARYFRVVYTNGGTNQTAFRLQSILNRTASSPSSNRASDGYTNETDLEQNQAFLMGYNGTTWDRLRSTGTGILNVLLAAGSAVIGHVITDSGSTTAVTGNVTVVQPTGTSLHAVLDTTSTTAVTQATAANLNATVVGTGTFATQSVVTQGTAANLNATVVGAGSAGTANAGVVTVQGIASMTKLLVTPDSVALPANQSVNVAQINGVTPLMGNGATGTGSQRVTIASDNTAFAVNATLSAETTKVIGTVNQGTSPWVTSNTTTSVVGNGAAATAQRVTLANDSTGIIATVGAVTAITNALPTGTNSIGKISDITASVVPGTAATNLGKAEDAAHASGDTGVMALAVRSDTAASTAGTTGDYQPPITNNIGALWVAGVASTNGGWLTATGSIGNTKTDIGTANTPGQVGGWYIYNANAAVAYVQFFNTQASGVTLGTTTPVYSLGIPPASAANIQPGMVGIQHLTAISIAVTTTRAGSTNTVSTVDYNIFYKQ